MQKTYYRITFTLTSAMSLGSGENVYTDKDMIRDSRNNPYVPGTSLAGIFREIYRENHTEKETEDCFGKVEIAKKANQKTKASPSLLYVYDANLKDTDKAFFSKRDCVGLDENKVSKKGAKFDFEIVEPGVSFVGYMEENGEANAAQEILSYIQHYGLQIGAKTMRGLGKAVVTDIQYAKFDLPKDKVDWLTFDMYDDCSWAIYTPDAWTEYDSKNISICLDLKQKGGVSIRQYTTDVVDKDHKTQPDYKQLSYTENGKTYAIIPGTSWSGAFRHHMKKLQAGEADLNWLFGSKNNEKDAHASRIYFSESHIEIGEEKGIYKTVSRTAIDRFTGSALEGALYTERYVCNGTTQLTIRIPKVTSEKVKRILAASITDLCEGYLAIGGLTSVGRGMFDIVAVNGTTFENQMQPEDLYNNICGILLEEGSPV